MPSTPPTAIRQADIVEGLGRGLRVIEAFDDDHPRLSASQVAELTGITRTAARRHLLSLVHFGYAATDGRAFWLLPRVLRLGQSYLGAARLPRVVQPFIQRVSQQCGETVNVSILDGHEVVYVARSNPPRWMSIGYPVGARVPAHAVTPGVMILSTWRDEDVRAWIAAHTFAGFTAHTVTDPAAFARDIEQARDQDHWIAAGQLDPSFGGICVALMDRRGQCVGAIGITVPSASYGPDEMRTRLLPLLQETVRMLRPLL